MTAIHLGELKLFAKNPSGNFFTWHMQNANITNELESALLDDPTHINGFDANGNDKALEEDIPDRSVHPIEVEAGTRRVFGTYQDAGIAENTYEVIVYLLVEEPEPRLTE